MNVIRKACSMVSLENGTEIFFIHLVRIYNHTYFFNDMSTFVYVLLTYRFSAILLLLSCYESLKFIFIQFLDS